MTGTRNPGKNFEINGKSFTSANQAMRRLFDLYANIRPAKKFKLPWATRFDDVAVDMVIVRENTEDLYCGEPEVRRNVLSCCHATPHHLCTMPCVPAHKRVSVRAHAIRPSHNLVC